MLRFKRKNLIALALAAVVAVSGFGVYKTQAAGRIDDSIDCYVSVSAEKVDASSPFVDFKGTVTVNFYKVADMDLTGKFDNVKSGVDLTELSKSNVKADTLDSIAESAYKAFKLDTESPEAYTQSVSFDLSDMSKASAKMGRGLYLFVPQPASDDRYDYSFKYSLVSVPTSKYIASTKVGEDGTIISDDSASDTWVYNVDLFLKPEATPRFGNINISKTLNTFNQSLGTAGFVYEVVAVRDEETVFDNVYTINFDAAGTQTITVEDVPAGAEVTVTEVYTGASYTAVEAKEVTDVEVIGNETTDVEFTNDYDGRLIEGGLSIENTFVKSEAENASTDYTWAGSNISEQ